jgi:hypothetical protein
VFNLIKLSKKNLSIQIGELNKNYLFYIELCHKSQMLTTGSLYMNRHNLAGGVRVRNDTEKYCQY